MNKRLIFLGFSFLLLAFLCLTGHPGALAAPARQEPEPVPDRLAIPVLPDHPTLEEFGRSVYYYHCMACHGDRGQGLTQEWREAWVEDHQNCWGRGCHGGKQGDQGFPLPRNIPALYEPAPQLLGFAQPDDLILYLERTHPPQNPGGLAAEDYQAVTSFLFAENGRPIAVRRLFGNSQQARAGLLGVGGFLLVAGLVSAALCWQARENRP